jgi:predicted alpha/beta superfamily hydrolase
VGLAQLSWLNSVTADYIVVGIESGRGLRIRDFTTPSELERKEFPVQGEAARFRRFLADELKPLIAARYRTSGETAVMGESLAGYFIVDTFLKQPDLFSTYIAVSPSLWWDGQSLTKQADALLAAPGRPAGRKLYLTVGNEGPIAAEAMGRLLAALKTHPAGVDVLYDPLPEEEHRSIYHPAGLRALRWAFPGPEALKK